MPVGKARDHPAIAFFGPRARDIARAKTRFDMGDRDLAMKRRHRARHRACRVTLHHHSLRALTVERCADGGRQTCQ